MADEREIWACALELIKQRGAGAGSHAQARAEALGASGATEGRRTFLLIADRIRQLEATAPPAVVN